MYTPCKIKDLQREDKNKNLSKAFSLDELLENCPKNKIIGDNLVKAWTFINDERYEKIVCTVSGGSDSDDMLDIIWRCDKDSKVEFVWFDTGLEYQATKEHLKYLENKYNIKIKPYRAIKPIPISCREFGQPFISKFVSEQICRLQRHNFKWEDKSFDELSKEYPNIVSAVKWWCNEYKPLNGTYNIRRNKWLKEFMVENPPTFKISSVCCKYAKKDIIHKLIKENGYNLNISGIRKAEGGIRSSSYKNCFDENIDGCDNYRPLFWYSDSDKEEYEEYYDVIHSDCYSLYGLKRTGCAGCPFGRDFEFELEVIEKHEPKLFKAVNNIFGDSYEYTRKYREFYKKKNEEEKMLKNK